MIVNLNSIAASHIEDAGGTGEPSETMEVDWSHSPQANRQSNKLVTPGDSWRDWLRTGGVTLTAYAPKWAVARHDRTLS